MHRNSNTPPDNVELLATTSAAGQQTSTTMRQRRGRRISAAGGTAPSYAESEWIEIIRRQSEPSRPHPRRFCADIVYTQCFRDRPGARTGTGALKLPRNTSSSAAPSPAPGSPNPDVGQTYPPLASKGPPQLANEWEFSGWGSVRFVELKANEIEAAARRRGEEKKRDGHEMLGAW